MPPSVTASAERDEILLGVIPELAARADVVYLEILRPATILAAPPIARQHLAPQFPIGCWAELEPRPLETRSFHEAVRSRSRNSAF